MVFGIGMPIVALAVENNYGMKQPDSNFYKELDSASKSIYDKTYSREYTSQALPCVTFTFSFFPPPLPPSLHPTHISTYTYENTLFLKYFST